MVTNKHVCDSTISHTHNTNVHMRTLTFKTYSFGVKTKSWPPNTKLILGMVAILLQSIVYYNNNTFIITMFHETFYVIKNVDG